MHDIESLDSSFVQNESVLRDKLVISESWPPERPLFASRSIRVAQIPTVTTLELHESNSKKYRRHMLY